MANFCGCRDFLLLPFFLFCPWSSFLSDTGFHALGYERLVLVPAGVLRGFMYIPFLITLHQFLPLRATILRKGASRQNRESRDFKKAAHDGLPPLAASSLQLSTKQTTR